MRFKFHNKHHGEFREKRHGEFLDNRLGGDFAIIISGNIFRENLLRGIRFAKRISRVSCGYKCIDVSSNKMPMISTIS